MRSLVITKSPVFTALVFTFAGLSLLSCGGAPVPPPPAIPAVAPSGYGSPIVAGRIEMADIDESSGLSASECQDVLWTHNDAGNGALIFGMTTEGKHLGAWRVESAENVDWESIASFKDPAGECFLIIGDIGDNDEAVSYTHLTLPTTERV